jgi:hypothetical protein
MATQLDNSQTLYFRPAANIPEYRIRGACRWLMYHYPKQFKDPVQTRLYLMRIEHNDISLYRSIMSRYFKASDYHPEYIAWRNPNQYYTTDSNVYGEEPHQYWVSGRY